MMRPKPAPRNLGMPNGSTSSVCSSSSTSSSSTYLRGKNNRSPTESYYDVPRTRPVLPRDTPAFQTIELQTSKLYSKPEYENFDFDDHRLQRSAFTTF